MARSDADGERGSGQRPGNRGHIGEVLQSQRNRGRFAPSTTGRAHPGTLLAGLLCWLDARATSGEVILRLEDLDRDRTKPGYVDAMRADLEWLGLDWDRCERQSDAREQHEQALHDLVLQGRVFACECSRKAIRLASTPAPDGSYRYPGTCRARVVTPGTWREIDEPLRLRIDDGWVELRDEGGADLSADVPAAFGDPLLRRRDGAFAYHFASVVDDAASGVGRVVRGRDLAPSTAVQVAIQRQMALPTPRYRPPRPARRATGREALEAAWRGRRGGPSASLQRGGALWFARWMGWARGARNALSPC